MTFKKTITSRSCTTNIINHLPVAIIKKIKEFNSRVSFNKHPKTCWTHQRFETRDAKEFEMWGESFLPPDWDTERSRNGIPFAYFQNSPWPGHNTAHALSWLPWHDACTRGIHTSMNGKHQQSERRLIIEKGQKLPCANISTEQDPESIVLIENLTRDRICSWATHTDPAPTYRPTVWGTVAAWTESLHTTHAQSSTPESGEISARSGGTGSSPTSRPASGPGLGGHASRRQWSEEEEQGRFAPSLYKEIWISLQWGLVIHKI